MTTLTNTKTQVDTVQEVSRFSLIVGMVSASLVGIWGLVCLVSALSSNGMVGLVKSYVTAVTGV